MNNKEIAGTILIADDTEENLVFLNKILSLQGYNTIATKSGDEAWEAIQATHPDLVLLDVHMPGLDGYEVCENIKANAATREIPVMFISAFHETIDKIKGFEAGGVDYITKPIQPNELLSRVQTHLNLSRVRNQLGEQANKLRIANRKLRLKVDAHKKAREEIHQLNETLEQRVNQRTAQLLSANKELEAFSYSVSHDLRAPLRAIDGFTRILIEDYEPLFDLEGKRICSVIRENSQRMGHLIDDLLTFSRLSRSAISAASIDMKALAMSVFQELSVAKTQSSLNIKIDTLYPVPGDLSMLRQVWFNLLDNAIKFSSRKQKQEISVTSHSEGNMIVFCIKDNGAGFDMLYVDKLFGVFQRLHSVKEYEGTGVGLAIVQRIIHKHGGRVWGTGVVDEGATFCFSLPATQPLK
ncbi:MAG: response regulator [Bacteroidetes bacterium]|nr:response regulator [Bacteroidota bacterium]